MNNFNQTKDELFQNIKIYFNNRTDISTVYVFGSYAKDRVTKDSDIDLAIIFFKDLSDFERFETKLTITNELEALLKMKVDIIDIESADPFFSHQILIEKLLLLDKDANRRVELEVKKRIIYFDRQPFYNLYHSQALKRLEELK